MGEKSLSIIICTYNRSGMLLDCLDSLERQSVDRSCYEVIVVDNNSTDSTKDVVKEYCLRNPNFRYVFEGNQGLSHARNRGVQEAEADWIGYVDDDGKVKGNYIEQALYTIQNFDFDCFGGKVVNWFKYGKPRWYPEIYDPEKEKYSDVCEYSGYISGGISFFKKETVLKHGGFNPELGMNGQFQGVGEETKLQIDIRESGGKIGFNPHIILEHLVTEEKLRLFYFIERSFYTGKSEHLVFKNTHSRKVSIVYIVLITFRSALVNLMKLFHSRYFVENYILDTVSVLSYLMGRYFSEKEEAGKQ